MKSFVAQMIRLFAGFVLICISMAMAYQTNLGMAPWNVLNDGISKALPVITFGQASIAVGLVIILIELIFREKIGLGTILNMLCIGFIFDGVMALDFLPSYMDCTGTEELGVRLVWCFLSLVPMALGTYLYMSAQLGAGPRDGLMCALTRSSGIRVGTVRVLIEATAFICGWIMGGVVGIGSVIAVLGNGPMMELVFRIFKFDVNTVRNETMGETMKKLRKSRPEQKA